MNKIVISNEEDALNFLEKYIDDVKSIEEVSIKNWENFHIHLVGEKYHQSITPSVMRGIIELQQAIYEAYAISRYNQKNVNRLTNDEKKLLELQVKVNDGSSELEIDINAVFNTLIEATAGKMSSGESLFLFVFAISAYFSYSAWKSWLENRTAMKEKEIDANQQTAVVNNSLNAVNNAVHTLEKIADNHANAREIYHRSNEVKTKLLRSTRFAENVDLFHDDISMSGEEIENITRNNPEEWQVVRLDGTYRLLKVDSSSTLIRKVKIKNIDTNIEILAKLEDNTLDHKNLDLLSTAEWEHHPAELKLKAKRKNGIIKEAEIISIERIDESITFDDSVEDDI